jgi:hypothetical protein
LKYTIIKKNFGYSCVEAVGFIKPAVDSILYKGFMRGVASPDKPFVNGVILEYQYGHVFGKAIKVERNH